MVLRQRNERTLIYTKIKQRDIMQSFKEEQLRSIPVTVPYFFVQKIQASLDCYVNVFKDRSE
mgnify:FL=1